MACPIVYSSSKTPSHRHIPYPPPIWNATFFHLSVLTMARSSLLGFSGLGNFASALCYSNMPLLWGFCFWPCWSWLMQPQLIQLGWTTPLALLAAAKQSSPCCELNLAPVLPAVIQHWFGSADHPTLVLSRESGANPNHWTKLLPSLPEPLNSRSGPLTISCSVWTPLVTKTGTSKLLSFWKWTPNPLLLHPQRYVICPCPLQRE